MFLFGKKHIEVNYRADDTTHINPLIGYAPSADNTEIFPDCSLVYIDITFKELEPLAEGDFDWETIDEKYNIELYKSEGKHAILRFICDKPSDTAHRDIPDWLYDLTGDGREYDIEYGKGYSPNYLNEIFIAKHKDAIEAIGRHFANDGFISYVELGSLGHWGEWHVFYPAGLKRLPDQNVRKQYLEPYYSSFPNARFLYRRPFADLRKGDGVYNDMTGADEDTYEWLDWIENGGIYEQTSEELMNHPNLWEEAPIGGEFASSIDMYDMLVDDYDSTLEMVRDSHQSFIGPMIPDVACGDEISEQAINLLDSIGYNYRISKLNIDIKKNSDEANLRLTIINDGVAPIYFDWPLCLYFIDEEDRMIRIDTGADLQKIVGDDQQTISIAVDKTLLTSTGTQIFVGIEDPDTGIPSVYLSMDTQRRDKMSLLYTVP